MKMKICLIIPSLRYGGSERVMSLLVNDWAKKKKDVDVYLILLTKQKRFYELHKDVTLIEPNSTYNKNTLSKLIYKFKTLLYIRKNCNQIAPNTILSFNEKYNNIVLLSLIGTPFKKYVSDRNSPFKSLGFFHNILRKILYKNATGIVAQTNTAKEVLLKETGNRNIKVIFNPLREITISDSKRENIILNIGRLVEQKNQLELIELFSKCDYKDWFLKIYGAGPLKQEIENKIIELKLQKHVELHDFTNSIDDVFSKSRIFALSSIYEGFPNALIEAMAHGLPPIAYDCPTGPKDIINDNVNGLLVPLSNKELYVEKLSSLMKSELKRASLSANASKTNEIYSLNRISNEYFNFILKS